MGGLGCVGRDTLRLITVLGGVLGGLGGVFVVLGGLGGVAVEEEEPCEKCVFSRPLLCYQ